jgi:hypothetical protein
MSRSLVKAKGRAETGGYLRLPHNVMRSPNYRSLSAHAVKLLIDIGCQFKGVNNGDLSAAWNIMKLCGWRSRDTLCHSLAELLHYGLIEKTRQGGMNRCSLYALTWIAIDDCRGKLDVRATHVPSGLWKIPQPLMPRRKRKNTASNTTGVPDRHGLRANVTRPACQ